MKHETRNAKRETNPYRDFAFPTLRFPFCILHFAFCIIRFAFRVSCFAFLLLPLVSRAQFDPDAPPTTSPATQPHDLKLITPTINPAQKQIEFPVNFWNEKMTGWIETALCGLPSDFSHETIIAATITRSAMVDALHHAGFVDADAWVSNVKDFPRIRGDKALILLQVTQKNKTETYLIDELLTWGGWNTSIGPYGWMYKGKPGENNLDNAAPATTQPTSSQPSTSPAPSPVEGVAVQVLRDDPQIALQFRGIQHSSQSFIDHPTCYDTGIYPLPRFYRNTKVLPEDVFDSNGDIPVKMTIRKVTEEQFITAAAQYWHDPLAAKYILQQLPIAQQIDTAKAELWKLIPAVRAQIQQSQQHPETTVLADSPEIASAAVLAAAIEKGYAALDCAWATWAADHCTPDADAQTDPDTNRALKDEANLLRQHAQNMRDRAAALYEFQSATAQKLKLRLAGTSDAQTKTQMRQLTGQAVEFKSRAQLAENEQVLAYWKYEQGRLDPKDPREDYIRQIQTELALAQARQTAAQTGITFGQALQTPSASPAPEPTSTPPAPLASSRPSPSALAAAQAAYQTALMQVTIASLSAQLAAIDFEIRKREGDTTDPDLPGLTKHRAELQQQLTAAQSATQPATVDPPKP